MNSTVDSTLVGLQTRPHMTPEKIGEKLAGSAGANGDTIRKFRKVAEDFESVFISEMLRPMFENIGAEAPFGGGQSEDIWKNLQIDEYGKAIAKSGGIGIADQVLDQMIRMQEAGKNG